MDLYDLLFPPTREECQEKVVAFVKAGSMIDLKPAIEIRGNKVDLLVPNGFGEKATDVYLCEVVMKEWVIHGRLSELTDDEFGVVYDAARETARRILALSRK